MRRYRSPFKIKLKKQTVAGISSVVFFTISVLLIFSFFAKGLVLNILRDFFTLLFGWGTFFYGLIGLIFSLSLLKLKWRFVQFHVVFGATLFMLGLLVLSAPFKEDEAGLIAQTLWEGTSNILTPLGAVIIFLGVTLIGLMVLLDTSLSQAVLAISSVIAGIKKYLSSWLKSRKGVAITKSPPVIKGMQPVAEKNVKSPSTPPPAGLIEETVMNLPTEGKLWQYPPLSLLSSGVSAEADRGDVKKNADTIEKTLDNFGIRDAKVVEVNCGPAVTQYALSIPAGTRISKITALQNDLALALAAPTGTVRIEAPIPGKSLVGIEVPNRTLEIVSLKRILSSEAMQSQKSKLAVALGLNVSGDPVVADIAKMPHVLMAGTTGSGKSVAINAFIASLLFRNSPNELKLLLVDPKRVELSEYNDIPHLLTPVIVEVEKILSALKWLMAEMDRRYKLFAQVGVRNLADFNELSGFQALPNIVVIIDELADLMAFAPVEVEDAIIRLAQMARATGIHLVLATQRPSVDVITGLIKANIPCRIAFNVSSMVDSRVIIDQPGAEKLLGRGDMLFLAPDASKPVRIQGVFVSEPELRNLITFLKESGVKPQYTQEVTEMAYGKGAAKDQGGTQDELFEEAVRTVCQYDRASASLLQRRLRIGYARAARLIDELEAANIVGPGEGAKPRDVLVRNAEEYLAARHSSKH